jgi:hypothetical protein
MSCMPSFERKMCFIPSVSRMSYTPSVIPKQKRRVGGRCVMLYVGEGLLRTVFSLIFQPTPSGLWPLNLEKGPKGEWGLPLHMHFNYLNFV